jgi:hypothetical protein
LQTVNFANRNSLYAINIEEDEAAWCPPGHTKSTALIHQTGLSLSNRYP